MESHYLYFVIVTLIEAQKRRLVEPPLGIILE